MAAKKLQSLFLPMTLCEPLQLFTAVSGKALDKPGEWHFDRPNKKHSREPIHHGSRFSWARRKNDKRTAPEGNGAALLIASTPNSANAVYHAAITQDSQPYEESYGHLPR